MLALGHIQKEWQRYDGDDNTAYQHSAMADLAEGLALGGCAEEGNEVGPYLFQRTQFFEERLSCATSYDALLTCQEALPSMAEAAAATWAEMLRRG